MYRYRGADAQKDIEQHEQAWRTGTGGFLVVDPPDGESPEELARQLEAAADLYKDNQRYGPFPHGVNYNSNGFVAGLLDVTRAKVPDLPLFRRWRTPGYFHRVPLDPTPDLTYPQPSYQLPYTPFPPNQPSYPAPGYPTPQPDYQVPYTPFPSEQPPYLAPGYPVGPIPTPVLPPGNFYPQRQHPTGYHVEINAKEFEPQEIHYEHARSPYTPDYTKRFYSVPPEGYGQDDSVHGLYGGPVNDY
jgi:hypothetical protein